MSSSHRHTPSKRRRPSARTRRAIIAGGFLFTAGQIALDPATGQVVEGDVAAQTERVMHEPDGRARRRRRDLERCREDDGLSSRTWPTFRV